MKIPYSDWQSYIQKLSAINRQASTVMQYWINKYPDASIEEMIDFAYDVSSRYGGAAATLACEMYDALAEAQGASVPAAEPAETATYNETAKAVRGTIKNKQNTVPATVGRLVKMAGADTMLQNAKRDRAQFAWVPMGDTCAFCLTLASRGWQYMSDKTLKNGHAEHIHANCDCEYCIRFDSTSTVEGYDPDMYLEMYENAEGGTSQEKINAMRRDIEAKKRELEAQGEKKIMIDSTKRSEYTSVYGQYRMTATPGKGVKEIAEGRKPKNRETENMTLLHREFGGDIIMPAENQSPGVHNPDYLWRGKAWEEQEPIARSRNAVDANIREAIHQIVDNPGGIVLDIGNSDMPLEEVNDITLKRLRRSCTYDCDVMIIRNGKVEEIFRYQKIKK